MPMPTIEKSPTAGRDQTMTLTSMATAQTRPIKFESLVVAGWTGRDVAAVQAHIDELAELGVRPPISLPTYYRVSVDLLTSSDAIQVLGNDSSGEVEPAIVALDGELWVGVGSDHTDRKAEVYSVDISKQMCQKPIAPELWRFADVEAHWDRLILRSKIRNDGGQWELYQEGTLAHIRPPLELIAKYPGVQGGRLANRTIMLCGTFSAIGGIRGADEFAFEMEDPVLGRCLKHAYRITCLEHSELSDARQQATS